MSPNVKYFCSICINEIDQHGGTARTKYIWMLKHVNSHFRKGPIILNCPACCRKAVRTMSQLHYHLRKYHKELNKLGTLNGNPAETNNCFEGIGIDGSDGSDGDTTEDDRLGKEIQNWRPDELFLSRRETMLSESRDEDTLKQKIMGAMCEYQTRCKLKDTDLDMLVTKFLPHVINLKNEFGEKHDKWLTGLSTYKRHISTTKRMNINFINEFRCPCEKPAYYVDLHSILTIMMSNESILSDILVDFEKGCSKDGWKRGIKDGNTWRGATIFKEASKVGVTNIDLRLILHIDDIDVSKSKVKSKGTNLTIVSFVLDNLPYQRTAKLADVAPVMVVRVADSKDDCLHHFISKIAAEIWNTQNNPIEIPGSEGGKYVFRPRIEAIVADNLAKVKIAAFVQTFQTGKCCSVCWTDFKDFFSEPPIAGYEYRTLETVQKAIKDFTESKGKPNDRTRLGVTGYRDGFNLAIPDFDICFVLPPDPFHDWTEGVMIQHFPIILKDILFPPSDTGDGPRRCKAKYVEEVLCDLINEMEQAKKRKVWEDGCPTIEKKLISKINIRGHNKKKVSEIDVNGESDSDDGSQEGGDGFEIQHLASGSSGTRMDDRIKSVDIKGTGQQGNDLFIHLPQLIPIEKRCGPAWEMYLVMRNIHSLIFARVINDEMITSLEDLIKQHLKSMAQVYPQYNLKYKAHLLLHYPYWIKKFGPPFILSTLRFERYLRDAKERIAGSKRHNKLPQTLMRRAIESRVMTLTEEYKCPAYKSKRDIIAPLTQLERLYYRESLTAVPESKFKEVLNEKGILRLKKIELFSRWYKMNDIISWIDTAKNINYYSIKDIWFVESSKEIFFIGAEHRKILSDTITKGSLGLDPKSKLKSLKTDEYGFCRQFFSYAVEDIGTENEQYEIFSSRDMLDPKIHRPWKEGSAMFIEKVRSHPLETEEYKEKTAATYSNERVQGSKKKK